MLWKNYQTHVGIESRSSRTFTALNAPKNYAVSLNLPLTSVFILETDEGSVELKVKHVTKQLLKCLVLTDASDYLETNS